MPSSSTKVCSVDDCDAPVKSRGWCRKHYLRWYKTGDPIAIRPARWDGYERPTCGVDDCDLPAHGRGLCQVHFPRMRRHGNPETITRASNGTSFWDLVDRDGDCWNWVGGKTTAGYGQFQGGYSHRHAVELDGRQIPEGHHVHHACENPGCVNPAHLVVLTPAEHRAAHEALGTQT